jgi:N-methylhydantoinase A
MPILGVDTGGTFTDFYLIGDDGSVSVYKRPSTPDDPARAIIEGLAEIIGEEGGRRKEEEAVELVHGSTVATNAIIERKGARTALITTRGFRDVLEIGRQTRPRLYDLSPQREPPLVPEKLRFEATERLDYRGDVLQALDQAEVEALLDRVQATGVESLAVCFLFSFLNPEHERVVEDAARKRGIATSASYEVLPEHREYERTSTTVANAYVAPVMERYLSRLEKDARGHGVKRLRVMSSNGGSISPASAGRLAIRTALSGPAGGVAGAFALAKAAGYDRIITLDMGGTSTDVALCPGRILTRDETLVGELPVRGPTVDVLSVGAGGGSIARLDEGGALRVGPESAGADPGPACYGSGTEPTVTDAHVVLGRIVSEQFLGGRMTIEPELSFEAIKRVARGFGGDAQRAAEAVLRVANTNMEGALRKVSVERGYDPRAVTLVAFGGAGPLHACELAAALQIPRVVVPPHPGVLSAFGMATAPVVKEMSAAVMIAFGGEANVVGAHDDAPLRETRDALEARGREEMNTEGFATEGLVVETFLEMRYAGQSYELSVPVESLEPGEFVPRFHDAHRERYGHADASRAVEVVTMRVRLVLPAVVENRKTKSEKRVVTAGHKTREVWFGGEEIKAAVYDREGLKPGGTFEGPALVVQMDSTTVVPPGWRAQVDGAMNLILEPS